MYQLQTNEQFPIVHLLGDPVDTGTYYVQAVIKDPLLNTTVATVNLTDRGSGLFTYTYQVPGGHRYLTITKTIYTDSGYTAKAENYPIASDLYLIEQRWSRTAGNAGGGDSTFIPGVIRKIIKEELDMAKATQAEIAMPTPVSLEPIEAILSDIAFKIDVIASISPPAPVDIEKPTQELKREINALQGAILKSLPKAPAPVDLQPIKDALGALSQSLALTTHALRQDLKLQADEIKRLKNNEPVATPINPRIERLLSRY